MGWVPNHEPDPSAGIPIEWLFGGIASLLEMLLAALIGLALVHLAGYALERRSKIAATAFWALACLVLFGGLYVLYVKHATRSREEAYMMLLECTHFNLNKGARANRKDEITALLASIRRSKSDLGRADDFARIISPTQGTAQTNSGMAVQLSECAAQLERSMTEIAQPES